MCLLILLFVLCLYHVFIDSIVCFVFISCVYCFYCLLCVYIMCLRCVDLCV